MNVKQGCCKDLGMAQGVRNLYLSKINKLITLVINRHSLTLFIFEYNFSSITFRNIRYAPWNMFSLETFINEHSALRKFN